MTAFDTAWQSVKKAINGKSISYYMTFDKIAEVEKAMGWKSFGNWHNILTNDNELLLWLEEKAQTDKYGPKYKEMMQKVLHSYMNDYDKGSMVLEEGWE